MSRRSALLTALLVALALCSTTSDAHESDPAVVTVLDSVTPALPAGVRVEVAANVAAQLVVENRTATPLEALADTGEAFLRVSSSGVAANLGSPAWYDSLVPSGRAPRTSPARAADRWARVQVAPSWGWFDHRLHPAAVEVTPAVRAAKRRARLAEWTVPMRYGDVDVTVRGHVEYRPLLGRIVAELTTTDLPGGVEITPIDGRVPGLFLRSRTTDVVRVMGPDGEVFAEIRPDRVLVNPRSRVHVEDARARGVEPRLAPAGGGGFELVSSTPVLSWLDLRLRYTQPAVPADVPRRGVPTALLEWTIPVRVGDRQYDITGATMFLPFERAPVVDDDPFGGNLFERAAVVFVPLALFAAVVVLRRRRTYDRANRRGAS